MEYQRKYNNKTFNKVENSDITYDEFSVLAPIKNYIDDSEDDSFDLKSLEKLYIDGSTEIGKSIDSHITRFAAKLVNADIGLTVVQSTSGGKHKTFKTSRLAAVIPDAEWCQMLRKVVEPISPLSTKLTKWPNILKQFVGNLPTNCLSVFGHFVGLALKGREEIFQVHTMEKSSMPNLSPESLSLQYKKLGFLIIHLCHGKPDANYLPLNLDTICQQIVFNTIHPPSSKS